jgi:hypothetical protein
MELEETAVDGQGLGKHVHTATNTHTTIYELLDANSLAVFMRTVPMPTLNL